MRFLLSVMLLMCAVACCASQDPSSAVTSDAMHAECLVCKHNADLACVDIAVTATTSHAQYNGVDYYFCSDECRGKFETNPPLYLKR